MTHDVLHQLLNLMGYCQKDIIVQITRNIKVEKSLSGNSKCLAYVYEGIRHKTIDCNRKV